MAVTSVFANMAEAQEYGKMTPTQKNAWLDYHNKNPHASFASWAGKAAPAPLEPAFTPEQQAQYNAQIRRIERAIAEANDRYDTFVANEPVVREKLALQRRGEETGRANAIGNLGVWGGGINADQMSDVKRAAELRAIDYENTKTAELKLRNSALADAGDDRTDLDLAAPGIKAGNMLDAPTIAATPGASGYGGVLGGAAVAPARNTGGAPAGVTNVRGPKRGRSVILNSNQQAIVPASQRASGTPGSQAITVGQTKAPRGYKITTTKGGRTKVTRL